MVVVVVRLGFAGRPLGTAWRGNQCHLDFLTVSWKHHGCVDEENQQMQLQVIASGDAGGIWVWTF